jgi:hypothetical protein
MATGTNLEHRVAALEAEVAQLKDRILNPEPKKVGWKLIVGTFLNDPYYEEAMRIGREYRESLRPKKKQKKKK